MQIGDKNRFCSVIIRNFIIKIYDQFLMFTGNIFKSFINPSPKLIEAIYSQTQTKSVKSSNFKSEIKF